MTVRAEHHRHLRLHYKLKWTALGLKALWDASVAHGLSAGGDDEFRRRVTAQFNLFDFERAVEAR
jgi:hypothetical protein